MIKKIGRKPGTYTNWGSHQLGFQSHLSVKKRGLRHEDVAELTGGESTIYLLENASGSRCVKEPMKYRDYSRHWTPVHIDVVVEDIEQAAARVLGCGAVQESECIEWRGSKCITFSDPFGHGFCLIEFIGEGYSTS